MTWDVCRCGHLLQSHQDADLDRVPCRLPSCTCPFFISEDTADQLPLLPDPTGKLDDMNGDTPSKLRDLEAA